MDNPAKRLLYKAQNLSISPRILEMHHLYYLNTSLYTSDKNKMFDCFKQYRYPYAKSIDEIIELERESLYEIANEFKYCKEIIIVGHHPMVSLRNKKIIEHFNNS